jgi:lipoprotein-releasing system permease protein
MVSLRYLRSRRKEGFISVIAGFSFLGIMLGVATLIIVMAVMNGFRKELLDKILGLNGHLLVQPLEQPLTDWEVVASASPRCPACALRRRSWRAGARVLAVQFAGVLVRGIRSRTSRSSPRSPTTSGKGTLKASTQGQGLAIGRRFPTSFRFARATTSRWSRRAAR